MFYWLIGNALLIYYVIVNLRLHIPWFDVCWRFGVVGLEWYPCRAHKKLNKIASDIKLVFYSSIVNMRRLFRFSLQTLPEIFLILRRNERDMIINVYWI